MRTVLLFVGRSCLYGFALVGFATVSVYVAMYFNLLTVPGSIEARNDYFLHAYEEAKQQAAAAESLTESRTEEVVRIVTNKVNDIVASTSADGLLRSPCVDPTKTKCSWEETPEWMVIKSALEKDAPVLARVEAETSVPARLIAAVVVPEQARFFSSNREVFKKWFEPMKLLGSLSQFSLGVSGIKQDTASLIENYANDPSSPFYPGVGMVTLIAYPDGADHNAELFARLTNEDDHYYSYLYTALFIKEVAAQWERAGFPIDGRAEIFVTLFNLGFSKSRPNAKPGIGGASLTIGNMEYTYGTLGGLFYYSKELLDLFPPQTPTT